MKNLFNKLKLSLNTWLSKQKWYQWGVKNEVQAHFYIIFSIGLLTLPLWGILCLFTQSIFISLLTSTGITFLLALSAMFLREFTNESGFSWKDILNGLAGYGTSMVIVFIISIVVFFILSL